MRRPEDISNRIANIAQIEDVVITMRGMATAYAREARFHLSAIREHESTIANATATAIKMLPNGVAFDDESQSGTAHLKIIVGASQGFTGAYSENLVSGVLHTDTSEEVDFILIGQRCIGEFQQRGITPVWTAAMAAHAAEVPALASRVAEILFDRLSQNMINRVSLVFVDPEQHEVTLTIRTLIPFDYLRFENSVSSEPPLLTISRQSLLERLVEEYVFTEICEALMLGFIAENEARMNAMTRARSNVKAISQDLEREYHQARQEQTTLEIIELSGIVRGKLFT
jgi:F-type H+-transporting ATPase subunit gamma